MFIALSMLILFISKPLTDFHLRTDPVPKDWKIDQINEGLPYRGLKGTIHLIAWEVIVDDRPHTYRQAFVIKQLDQPTKEGHRWLLACLYYRPDDKQETLRSHDRIPRLRSSSDKTAMSFTTAQLFGYQFYKELPDEKAFETYIGHAFWNSSIGTHDSYFDGSWHKNTIRVNEGGFDRNEWKRTFNRKVPVDLFFELNKDPSRAIRK